jgi:hypothetical protein
MYVCFFCFFCVHKKNSVHKKKQCTQNKQNKQNKTICSFSPHPVISFVISLLETSNMAQIIVPQLPMSLIQALSGGAGSISPLSFFPLVVDLRGGGVVVVVGIGGWAAMMMQPSMRSSWHSKSN